MELPKRVFLILLSICLILLVAHLTAQHFNLAYNEKHGQIFEISNRLDMDDEASLPTWFSQFIWLCVAACSLLAFALNKEKGIKRLWLAIALLAVFFSIDEVAGLHEFLLQSLHLIFFGLSTASSTLNAWWLVLPLVILGGVWLVIKLYTVLSTRQWLILITGAVLFLIGAVGFELYGNDIPHNNFYYQGVIVGIEESLEMLGGILVLYSIIDYLKSNYKQQLTKLWHTLSE